MGKAGSRDSGVATSSERRMGCSVERVIREIVETEAIYVEHLRQVIQGYLNFWRQSSSSREPSPLGDNSHYLGDLFGNIEDIFELNSRLLGELNECPSDAGAIPVARVFIRHNAELQASYADYCTNYPRAVSLLTELMAQDDLATVRRSNKFLKNV